MSTNDVPGYKEEHNDELAMGCWAEHRDGSLIIVESVEAEKVIYSIFDTSTIPVTEYRDAMIEESFKKQFSWNPLNPKSEKWTWHDKTPFDWSKVMDMGGRDGVRYPSAVDQLNAAQRVARSLQLRGNKLPSDPNIEIGANTKNFLTRLHKAIDILTE